MAIFELRSDQIVKIPETSFDREAVRERADLQRLLRENVDCVCTDILIISEEFGSWDDSRRRIDLLGIDRAANLVVIELKRDDIGGHMELQAIRYAALISTMTFEQAVAALAAYQQGRGVVADAQRAILDFLGWEVPNEDQFAQAVRIVLVSADFSKELTTSVMWLNSLSLDIQCVRLRPYNLDGRLILDVQQIIPLPEAAEYQVQIREKNQREKQAKEWNVDFTRYDVSIGGERHEALWKRGAIHTVVSKLLRSGIIPEDIAQKLDKPVSRLWRSVDGNVNSELFRAASREKARSGPAFDERRWFCADDELIASNGKTFAFTNQWGGPDWHAAMNRFVKGYPQFKIEFKPVEE